MGYTYHMRKDTNFDEAGKAFDVYGIEAKDVYGFTLASVSDIFFDLEKAKAFVKSCNYEKVELVHLLDVVEDALI